MWRVEEQSTERQHQDLGALLIRARHAGAGFASCFRREGELANSLILEKHDILWGAEMHQRLCTRDGLEKCISQMFGGTGFHVLARDYLFQTTDEVAGHILEMDVSNCWKTL